MRNVPPILTEIADKEAEVEQLLGDLNEGTEDPEQDDADDRGESEETDLALHLAPLPREELEELIARLVAWRPELGERVLEIAHRPVDIGAIPYRVEQLTHARASPQEFAAEIFPLAKRAHDYALAGDVANARAMAEALTRSVAAAYPTPGIMHECVDSMTKSSSLWVTLFEPCCSRSRCHELTSCLRRRRRCCCYLLLLRHLILAPSSGRR